MRAVVMLSQGLANGRCRHSNGEDTGCGARTLRGSAQPAARLKDSVGAPARSLAGLLT